MTDQNKSNLEIKQALFDADVYVLKTITAKSQTHPAEVDIFKFIAITADQNLLCVEVIDRGFILQAEFPKEGTYLRLKSLQFQNCTLIDQSNLHA